MNASSARLDLHWLPSPEAWASRIAEIERMRPGPEAWEALRQLADTRLDFLRTGRLDTSLARLFGQAHPESLSTPPVRLAVLGASTTTHLAAGIRIAALRRDLWLSVYEPDYGQYLQELRDPQSALHRFRPTAVLLSFDARHLLPGGDPMLDAEQAKAEVEAALDSLRGLWRSVRESLGAQVIQQTILPLAPPLLGLNEHRLAGSTAALTFRLNARLREVAAEDGVDLLTLDTWAAQAGLDAWHDPTLWTRAKQEISPAATPMYGDLVARLVASGQGRVAKCLVLDLDNTLWGGVIGDDGLEGIVLGQGSPLGEAFSAFQTYAAALARRGVILAVCSKNDEANALAPFDRHPEMVLKRADISAFVANWDDKATNLREIARRLNIGLDALVFADDNPFERNLVRRELPMVSVPELPEEPALYARCISDAGYFEALALTAEDRDRTEQYQANRRRESLQGRSTDLPAYLRSLDMTLSWRAFDALGSQRITQLINKTNQFNLTTRRYSIHEVEALIGDPRAVGLQLRLADRFGDNGIIAVVIGRLADDEALVLDSWLMSCRVLGRRVEEATLAIVVAEADRLGATHLIGRYLSTEKNAMVADLYARLGFSRIEATDGGPGVSYRLAVADYTPPELPIIMVKD